MEMGLSLHFTLDHESCLSPSGVCANKHPDCTFRLAHPCVRCGSCFHPCAQAPVGRPHPLAVPLDPLIRAILLSFRVRCRSADRTAEVNRLPLAWENPEDGPGWTWACVMFTRSPSAGLLRWTDNLTMTSQPSRHFSRLA